MTSCSSSWIADYADPSAFLDIWRSDSGNNFTGWSNADYDGYLFAAERNADPAARNALFSKAEHLLLSEAPFIPIYHYTHVYLIRPSVQGGTPPSWTTIPTRTSGSGNPDAPGRSMLVLKRLLYGAASPRHSLAPPAEFEGLRRDTWTRACLRRQKRFSPLWRVG